jgi:hypothetical protein
MPLIVSAEDISCRLNKFVTWTLQGVLWAANSATIFTGNDDVEAAKEIVQIISKSNPIDNFRLPSSVSCTTSESVALSSPGGIQSTVATPRPDCEEFIRAAEMKRRTHPYFVVGAGDDKSATDQKPASGPLVDVTLATQLTIDRFPSLERMVSNWEGPVSVALHVTDEEADELLTKISSSSKLRNRKRISYHVVYKRLVRVGVD